MNIIFGGSFNPPTKAHLEIVLLLNKTYNPKHIIILPVGNHYNLKDQLLSFDIRYKMLLKTFSKVNNVIISTLERDSFKGTLVSLDELSKTYSDIHFVVGADNLLDFNKWINYETLLKKYAFIVITRPNYLLDLTYFNEFKTKYQIINYDNNISSTKVRENPKLYKQDLVKEVYEYIISNNLYGGNLDVKT